MMRWLLGLLLLVNLGLFMWIQTRVVSQQQALQETIRPPGVQEILLLRETEQRQSNDAKFELEQDVRLELTGSSLPQPDQDIVQEGHSVESVDLAEDSEVKVLPMPVETEQQMICGRIGPYEDSNAAETLRDKLKPAGVSMDIAETTEQIKTGYWVLIPVLPSRQEANQMVKKLKAAGVEDLWLINKGPMKNAISLGLYAGPSNASRHSRNINEKGFDSEVSPKMSEQTRYWLDYSAVEQQVPDDWLNELSQKVKNEKKACK